MTAAALTSSEADALFRAISEVVAGELGTWSAADFARLSRAAAKLATRRRPLSSATERLLRDIEHELRCAWSTTGRSDWCIEIPKSHTNALLRRIAGALAREGRKGEP